MAFLTSAGLVALRCLKRASRNFAECQMVTASLSLERTSNPCDFAGFVRGWRTFASSCGPLLQVSFKDNAFSGQSKPSGVSSEDFTKIALVRGIPETFTEALTLLEKPEAIDVAKAREQHAAYVDKLKELVPRVIEIPADDRYPDCCFIEDTAVVRGGGALITRPGNVKRQGEVTAVKETLQELGLRIMDPEPGATIDGGDVLQGRDHIFVGLSSRTNEAGVEALRAAFPGTPVVVLPVRSGLHLKSGLSWVGPNTLAVEDSPEVLEIYKMIKEYIPALKALRIPDRGAANALLVNGVVLYPSAYPKTSHTAYQSLPLQVHPVYMSEIHKADGGLTCNSILIK